MKIENKFDLWEEVSTIGMKNGKLFIYKIWITMAWIEYLLWDWYDNYPGWFHEFQLTKKEKNNEEN